MSNEQELKEDIQDLIDKYGYSLTPAQILSLVSAHYKKKIAELGKELTKERTVWKPLAIAQARAEEQAKVLGEVFGKMCMRNVGGINPEWAISDKEYQALKPGQKVKK